MKTRGKISAVVLCLLLLGTFFAASCGKTESGTGVNSGTTSEDGAASENGMEAGPGAEDICVWVTENEIGLGEDSLALDYSDGETIIFHEKYGLFVYDITQKKLTGITWEALGCSGIEYDVTVEADGTKVYIQPDGSAEGCVYDVADGTSTLQEISQADVTAFSNLAATSDYVEPDHTVYRTENCVPLDGERYLYLQSGSGMLRDLFYVIRSADGTQETACMFGD